MRYGFFAQLLFRGMDLLYGSRPSFQKFKVLEIVARVPYQAWEVIGYVAITHTSADQYFARRIFDRVRESRVQQDNEQWHLLILEELIERKKLRVNFFLHIVVPQALAFAYYYLSWLLYAVRPDLSYLLNAELEDHAEHEYAQFVLDHPELESEPFHSAFEADYGSFGSLADLFRQIGYDERTHKLESLAHIENARFR
ncbi:MAG: hypothetical protein JOZ38_12480 [Candidatus Eremiobacteraeota bacterium]|nr:hypothetical protein [Candidatus Eremiobacteraeota bacterium]